MSAANSTTPHHGFHCEDGVCYRTLDFLGFPGYRVGDDGSVWSRIYQTPQRGKFGQIVKTTVHYNGSWNLLTYSGKTHRRVTFWPSQARHLVHRLVLLAFVGPCPPGMEACHFPNRNPTDNRLCNLRWGTKRDNYNDAVVHGTNAPPKLTGQEVCRIRDRYARGGVTMQALADEYKVCLVAIWKIIHRKMWTSV